MELTSRDMTYIYFCKAVVHAGKETAITIDHKKDGTRQANAS